MCVKMIEWFEYNGNMWIEFEMIGISVLEFMKDNS
jgi:hypothetical protein